MEDNTKGWDAHYEAQQAGYSSSPSNSDSTSANDTPPSPSTATATTATTVTTATAATTATTTTSPTTHISNNYSENIANNAYYHTSSPSTMASSSSPNNSDNSYANNAYSPSTITPVASPTHIISDSSEDIHPATSTASPTASTASPTTASTASPTTASTASPTASTASPTASTASPTTAFTASPTTAFTASPTASTTSPTRNTPIINKNIVDSLQPAITNDQFNYIYNNNYDYYANNYNNNSYNDASSMSYTYTNTNPTANITTNNTYYTDNDAYDPFADTADSVTFNSSSNSNSGGSTASDYYGSYYNSSYYYPAYAQNDPYGSMRMHTAMRHSAKPYDRHPRHAAGSGGGEMGGGGVAARSLWVGNIPLDTDEDSLKAFFEPYGAVSSVFIHINDRNRFAFVRFDDIAGAISAQKLYKQSPVYKGNILKIGWAKNSQKTRDVSSISNNNTTTTSTNNNNTNNNSSNIITATTGSNFYYNLYNDNNNENSENSNDSNNAGDNNSNTTNTTTTTTTTPTTTNDDSSKRNLFVAGIESKTKDEIKADFAQFGELEALAIHQLFAFVLYKSPADAQKAFKSDLNSTKYRIHYARNNPPLPPLPPRPPPTHAPVHPAASSAAAGAGESAGGGGWEEAFSPTPQPEHVVTTTTPVTITATVPATPIANTAATATTVIAPAQKPHMVTTVDITHSMTYEESQKLNRLLYQLSATNRSIRGLKDWILLHMRSGKEIAECVKEIVESQATSITRKVTIIYLVHDLLYHCHVRRKSPDVPDRAAEMFEPHLAALLGSLKSADKDTIQKVIEVIDIWEKKKIYPSRTIHTLKNLFILRD